MGLTPGAFQARRQPRIGAGPRGIRAATLATALWLLGGAFFGWPAPAVGQESAADRPTQDFAERVDHILQDLEKQRSRRLDDLGGQIDILERILDDRSRRSPGPQPPPATVEAPLPDLQNPIRPAPDTTDRSAEAGPAAQEPARFAPATPPSPVRTKFPPVETPPDVAPVDPLALADSLFGADEIELALKTYQGISPNEYSDPDRRWIRYQIATCQRRLGQIGAAEQEYRELLGANKEDFVADHARWWLSTIQTRKRMTAAVQGIETALKTLQEQKP